MGVDPGLRGPPPPPTQPTRLTDAASTHLHPATAVDDPERSWLDALDERARLHAHFVVEGGLEVRGARDALRAEWVPPDVARQLRAGGCDPGKALAIIDAAFSEALALVRGLRWSRENAPLMWMDPEAYDDGDDSFVAEQFAAGARKVQAICEFYRDRDERRGHERRRERRAARRWVAEEWSRARRLGMAAALRLLHGRRETAALLASEAGRREAARARRALRRRRAARTERRWGAESHHRGPPPCACLAVAEEIASLLVSPHAPPRAGSVLSGDHALLEA